MRSVWSLVFFVLFWGPCRAVVNTTTALSLLASMPQCGSACLLTAIAASPCSATDLECSCSNATLTAIVEECVTTSCGIRQQLTSKNTTATLCSHPIRDRTHLVSYSGIIGLAFAIFAYVLRISGKIQSPCSGGIRWTSTLWWDDFMMTVAMLLIIPVSATSVVLAQAGLGRDIWTLPFENITKILKIYYFDEDLYLSALPAVKISMLLTYLRVFQSTRFKQVVYVVITLNFGYCIAFVLVSVFQCTPVSLAWTRWDGEYGEGHCSNINAQGWTSALFNVILDILTLSLPLPLLWKFQLNKRKKFLVMLMFSLGFFVTLVSILRLQVLIEFGNSKNITWDYTAVGYWSTIELHTAVIAASLPAIRNLIRRYLPRLMGSTAEESRGITSTGLSGTTAINSGIIKTATQIQVRPRESDEENFIPLQDVGGHDRRQHSRNFSMPHHGTSAPRAPSPVRTPFGDSDDHIMPPQVRDSHEFFQR
ncbi:hypothetical protein DOTSEDRAFT_71707 [Dothistroma septosporum NZE10]|uniref:CFEM domain-containing protein n=1 Tax=Dothistroma septosporum (strain NZE10 / CBS 128990) TaxID=675120 RepID=N1PNM6_DOTSN|nr:hypothetical protein DOTSEDRAFT_71707 [Dothistroma septosporum NZE10]